MSRLPGPSDHEALDQLAVGWALHALEPEDETAFARHLPGCARCAATVAETEEVMAAMALDLPQAEPSPDLRVRLRAAAERTEQVPGPQAPSPTADRPGSDVRGDVAGDAAARVVRPPAGGNRVTGLEPPDDAPVPRSFLRSRGPALALAAALAAVLSLGVWSVALDQDRDRAQSVAAEQSAVVEELLRPGVQVVARLSGGSDAVATLVRQDGGLQVVSQRLPVNDDEQVYVLWGLQGEQPVALGTFDVERSGLDLQPVVSTAAGSEGFDAYAVSIEPGRQPPASPSEVVASGQVTS